MRENSSRKQRRRTTQPRDARGLAYDLTRRVNEGGAYLGLLLRYTLEKTRLDPRDRSLVVELCYGVQRHRNLLDHYVSLLSDRPLGEIDAPTLDVLRLGIYQLNRMGIPVHAAVNESVSLAKSRLGPGPASFVNAVMRRASVEMDALPLPSRDRIGDYLEVIFSHPRWLVDMLLEAMGAEEAEALCASDNSVPSLTLRANTSRSDAQALLRRVLELGGTGRLSPAMPEVLLEVTVPHHALESLLREGLCVVQDVGSVLVGYVVAPREGDLVIDACAAPGGKATHLALLGGPASRILAVDVNPRRVKAMEKSVRRMGLQNVEIKVGDSRRLSSLIQEEADLVLVDAPCSGLGTIRRNPELRWRRNPEDLPVFTRLQLSLLEEACKLVKKGGALIYSVCTYTREETLEVLEGFLSRHHDYRTVGLGAYLPEPYDSAVLPSGPAQLLPHRHGCEGMFVARLSRT